MKKQPLPFFPPGCRPPDVRRLTIHLPTQRVLFRTFRSLLFFGCFVLWRDFMSVFTPFRLHWIRASMAISRAAILQSLVLDDTLRQFQSSAVNTVQDLASTFTGTRWRNGSDSIDFIQKPPRAFLLVSFARGTRELACTLPVLLPVAGPYKPNKSRIRRKHRQMHHFFFSLPRSRLFRCVWQASRMRCKRRRCVAPTWSSLCRSRSRASWRL